MSSNSRVLKLRVTAALLALAGVVAAVGGVGAWMVSGCCGSSEPADGGLLAIGALSAAGLWFMAYQCHAAASRPVQPSTTRAAGMTPKQRTVYWRVVAATLALPGVAAAAWGVGNWWGSSCCGSTDREVGFLLVGGVIAGCLWALAWWCVTQARGEAQSRTSGDGGGQP